MQRAFLVILIAAHVSVTVDCRPRFQHPWLQQQEKGSSEAGTPADTSAGTARLYFELNGSIRKGNHVGLLGESAFIHTNKISFIANYIFKRYQSYKCKEVQILSLF